MREFGGYQLLTRLSTGALGELFLARPTDGSRDAVLLERVHSTVQDLHFTRTLNMEASAGIGFSHPGAVQMLEVGQTSEGVFIVFEFVRGQPLSDVLRRAQVDGAALSHSVIAWVGAQLAATLAAAHAVPCFEGAPTPLVHGSVSPRAVIVTYDGQVKLSGIGYGRARARVPPLLARLPYIAPEVLRGREITPNTDVYGLGITLHHALTGRAVYRRPNEERTRAAVLAQNAPPIPARNLAIAPEISDLLRGMMAARPEARPVDLSAVEASLRSVVEPARDFPAELSMRLEALFVEEREAIERRLDAADRAARRQGPTATPSQPLPAPISGGYAAPTSGGHAPPISGGYAAPLPEPIPSPPSPPRPPAAAPEVVRPPPPDPAPAPEARPASPVVFTRVEPSSVERAPKPAPELPSTPPAVLQLDPTPARVEAPPASATAEPEPEPEEGPDLHVRPVIADDEDEDFEVTFEDELEPEAPAFMAAVLGPAALRAPSDPGADPNDESPAGGGGAASGAFAGLLDQAAAAGVVDHLPEFEAPAAGAAPAEEQGGLHETPVLARFTSAAPITVAEPEAPEPDDELTFEAPPVRFGRYSLLELLYGEGLRTRYLARDGALERDVWLDVVEAGGGAPGQPPESRLARFALEARWLSRLAHPRLPAILDYGDEAGTPFLVRPALRGAPIEGAQRWPEEAVRALVTELAAALDALHGADLLAGGLRLQDLWLDDDGRANVVDLPRMFAVGEAPPAALGEALDVQPPECLGGAPFGPGADLFSLGLIAHRLLTNKDALPAEAAARTAALSGGQVPVPTVSDPKLQEALRGLLAAAPRARLSSAAQVLEVLGAAEGGPHAAPSPAPREADVVLIDPDLVPASARRTLAARGVRAAVYRDLESALTELPRLGARTVVVARSVRADEEVVRRQVAAVAPGADVRYVPRAAARLVGPPLSLEGLSYAWLSLAPRVIALAPAEGGFVPSTAARAMASALNLGLRAELLASLTAGARMLARRLGESPANLPVGLPEEVPAMLEAIERVDAGTLDFDAVDVTARVVVVADAFYRATRLDRVAPSRALADLKESLQGRAARRVIEALLVHLRELYATGDLAPPAEDAPRVLLARRARTPALIKMLEFDGLQVEEAADGHEAWELLRALRPRIAILDADLEGRDGASLVELSHVHPAMSQIRFLLLGDSEDAELRARVATLPQVSLVDRAASVEALRARVSALVEG